MPCLCGCLRPLHSWTSQKKRCESTLWSSRYSSRKSPHGSNFCRRTWQSRYVHCTTRASACRAWPKTVGPCNVLLWQHQWNSELSGHRSWRNRACCNTGAATRRAWPNTVGPCMLFQLKRKWNTECSCRRTWRSRRALCTTGPSARRAWPNAVGPCQLLQ